MGVLAVPVAAAGYLIYQKSLSFAGEPESAAGAPVETAQVVAVAPSYADPEQLRRKQDLEALRQQEALARQKQLDEQAAAATQPTGKSRVITLGPSARREQPVYTPPPEDPSPSYGRQASSAGPKIYQSEEDFDERQAREDANLRQRGVRPYRPPPQPEAPLMPFSGSSSSVGTPNYSSSSRRSSSSGSRN
jgi:hypothetical protein